AQTNKTLLPRKTDFIDGLKAGTTTAITRPEKRHAGAAGKDLAGITTTQERKWKYNHHQKGAQRTFSALHSLSSSHKKRFYSLYIG
ncbi:hypothetical protein, partial [Candidatus Avelusimicrobium alvi]|uniref:hypothetical protein n=1 Tax=Candidatus Avelusimicrobium alvi TaxID=3416221 RepID=UPI003D12F09A